mmetsp:Transcript_57374/g.178089  ORF Transcript_57374/g.178089 Transcript_57374/m.178089 type:complete len:211 (+) Transcript_57374:182-814(+)
MYYRASRAFRPHRDIRSGPGATGRREDDEAAGAGERFAAGCGGPRSLGWSLLNGAAPPWSLCCTKFSNLLNAFSFARGSASMKAGSVISGTLMLLLSVSFCSAQFKKRASRSRFFLGARLAVFLSVFSWSPWSESESHSFASGSSSVRSTRGCRRPSRCWKTVEPSLLLWSSEVEMLEGGADLDLLVNNARSGAGVWMKVFFCRSCRSES